MKGHMMLLMLIISSGCASLQTVEVKEPVNNTFYYEATFDQVWNALLERATDRSWPIKTIEKASGIIVTDFLSLGNGFTGWNNAKVFAYQPSSLLGSWTGGARMTLSAFISKETNFKIKVKLVPHFEVFEDNVSHQWVPWESNGKQESTIDSYIRKKLGGNN